jgi:hypothetical protein
MASVGLILILLSIIPFFLALTVYPRTTPTIPKVTTVPLPLVTNASSIETFVIASPNHNPLVGFPPTNTITYSVQGSSITSQTPLNISVALNIDWAYSFVYKYYIRPESVVIDNSVLSNGIILPQLSFTLVKNDSHGLVYSTDTVFLTEQLPETIKLTEAGQLTGTVLMLIASKADPNSAAWFQGYYLQVRNTTAITVQSFHDLQLEKQANFLENANLENYAQLQYVDAETQYNNGVVTTLTYVIIGFMMVDIGISFYDVSEKKNQVKKDDATQSESKADYYENPEDYGSIQ